MEKNNKEWKPGQLITANKKVYRVLRSSYTIISGCYACRSVNGMYTTPCRHSYEEWQADKENKLFCTGKCKAPKMCYLRPMINSC